MRAQLKDQAVALGSGLCPVPPPHPAGISTQETLWEMGSLPCPEFRGTHTRRGRSCLGSSTEGAGRSQSQVRAQVGHVPPLCGGLALLRIVTAVLEPEQWGSETALKYKLLLSAPTAQGKNHCSDQPVRPHLRKYK